MEQLGQEELNQILDRINSWIENCDSKTSTILSGIGILAGIFLATDYVSKFINVLRNMCKNFSAWSIAYMLFSALSVVLMIVGTIFLVCVLFARINLKDYEKRGVKPDSLIFFSSIAQYSTLSKYKGKMKKCTPERLNEEIVNQIYICSLICDKKFRMYKRGLILSIFGFILFAMLMVLGVVVT